jgi:hypothetical protein
MHALLLVLAPLAAPSLVQVFIALFVIAILTTLLLWVMREFGAPKPFQTLALVVGVLFAVFYVLNAFGLLSGF